MRRTIKTAEGLTAAEFFARKLPGFSMHAAHYATRISYSAISDIVHGTTSSPRRETIERLQRWSLAARREHGVYLSAAKTLRLEEPSTQMAAEG